MTRSLKARLAHDEVFGLLPLVTEACSSRLEVQYNKSLPNLFADVGRVSIEEDGNLSILGCVDLRKDSYPEMASWVPDWRKRSPTLIVLNSLSADETLFRSAIGTRPMTRFHASAETLVLRGFPVASVTRGFAVQSHLKLRRKRIGRDQLKKKRWRPGMWELLYTRAAFDSGIPFSVVRHPEQQVSLPPLAALAQATPGLDPVEMLQVALRRTVTADLYPRPGGRLSESAILENFPAYDAWQKRNFNHALSLAPKRVLWEHDQFVKTTMFNRRAFIADEHDDAYLGIGLKTLQESDWVCILYGGHTPFILRPIFPTGIDDIQNVKEWIFVSECYVHGLMDGEAMERMSHPDFKEIDFVLSSSSSSKVLASKL